MTAAECEIVAEAGQRLQEIIVSMRVLPETCGDWREELSEVYGKLATLPLENEHPPEVHFSARV